MHISVNIIKTTELHSFCKYTNYTSTKLLKQANKKELSRLGRADGAKGNCILQKACFMARQVCTEIRSRNSRRLERKVTGRGRKGRWQKLLSPHYKTIGHLDSTQSF